MAAHHSYTHDTAATHGSSTWDCSWSHRLHISLSLPTQLCGDKWSHLSCMHGWAEPFVMLPADTPTKGVNAKCSICSEPMYGWTMQLLMLTADTPSKGRRQVVDSRALAARPGRSEEQSLRAKQERRAQLRQEMQARTNNNTLEVSLTTTLGPEAYTCLIWSGIRILKS